MQHKFNLELGCVIRSLSQISHVPIHSYRTSERPSYGIVSDIYYSRSHKVSLMFLEQLDRVAVAVASFRVNVDAVWEQGVGLVETMRCSVLFTQGTQWCQSAADGSNASEGFTQKERLLRIRNW
jgi:hypothetical protein